MARSQAAGGRATLTELAKLGFAELSTAKVHLEEFEPEIVAHFRLCADPDQALRFLSQLRERSPEPLATMLTEPDTAARLIRVLGASSGLGDFFRRRPEALECLAEPLTELPSFDQMRAELRGTVQLRGAAQQSTSDDSSPAILELRVGYRRILARIAAFDLEQSDQLAGVDAIASSLADLAGAAIDVALTLARESAPFSHHDVEATGFSVIAMGKTGAQELNYLSDVDVIYVAEARNGVATEKAVEIATWLAMHLGSIIQSPEVEPELWELDANLRPEGKDGALVRSLESHLAYYGRWAKDCEFQALLKARPIAGDLELGDRFVDALAPLVWSSASRDNFVESVQRMRERVTEHIPSD
ncbi:MAG: bifunctional glutamine-synthetase adenylyltransferase/deadenyltransferase, partial [Terrimesophilobacter sp.]